MRRSEQLAKTRTAIMKTATKLFLNNGFGGTSTRDIAKEIGITQPALYHHFNDKEVLFLDVMTSHGSRVRQEVNKVMRESELKGEERLWELAKTLLRLHPKDIYEQWQSAGDLLSQSSKRKLNVIFMIDYIEPVSEFFKQPDIKMRPDVLPKEAAELFISSLSPMFNSFQKFGGRSITQEQRNRIILDIFMNGLNQR
ncbi:MAG TPA: TetR/AcrR family transcriptional regulator [Limosilactobacillus coleohominis]|uniref:Transcriptional regulator, TetR family n=1 Tax=Limosilactobacillus coleohominis 101-4-CHN TaxID=575594 RepID=C7XVQ2_9LACO|nr:TetR/AcrR family transcriptional regulator [Limosilactobacillus coleohominis]EEU30418.1 transcriptional regulator, TetR family [Limosilactobacillus coleohominis 101-4-CHN]KRM80699.1 transcriptional regulator [Limosilactobacillus coleohominis DSM 14060]HJF54094.1 TetR/AcrR family transcriptional regulator [Limosilactobacillus coleohominis]